LAQVLGGLLELLGQLHCGGSAGLAFSADARHGESRRPAIAAKAQSAVRLTDIRMSNPHGTDRLEANVAQPFTSVSEQG